MSVLAAPRAAAEDETRFWSLVDRSGGPDACWPWRGAVHKRTRIGQHHFRGRTYTAPRLAYQLTTGSVPKRLWHTCFAIDCCNPAHGTEKHPRFRSVSQEVP